MNAIVRIKRRADEDPMEAVILSCKRKRTESSVLRNDLFEKVWHFVGTVKDKDDRVTTITVEKVKRDLNLNKTSFYGITEIITKQRKEQKKKTKGRRILKRRRFRSGCENAQAEALYDSVNKDTILDVSKNGSEKPSNHPATKVTILDVNNDCSEELSDQLATKIKILDVNNDCSEELSDHLATKIKILDVSNDCSEKLSDHPATKVTILDVNNDCSEEPSNHPATKVTILDVNNDCSEEPSDHPATKVTILDVNNDCSEELSDHSATKGTILDVNNDCSEELSDHSATKGTILDVNNDCSEELSDHSATKVTILDVDNDCSEELSDHPATKVTILDVDNDCSEELSDHPATKVTILDVSNDCSEELSDDSVKKVLILDVSKDFSEKPCSSGHNEPDECYVYDLYSFHQNGPDIPASQEEDLLSLAAYESSLECTDEEGCFEVDDEDDSNDENNWRNDYPDEDPGAMYDENDSVLITKKLKNCSLIRQYVSYDEYNLSDDEGEENYLHYDDSALYHYYEAEDIMRKRYAKFKVKALKFLNNNENIDTDSNKSSDELNDYDEEFYHEDSD